MMNQKRPRWGWLLLIGLFFTIALIEEARLPFTPSADSWLIGVGVLLFYGIVMIWITHNREALEGEPRPLDFVGRPIIDDDTVKFEAEPDSHSAKPYQPTHSLNQSEAI